MNLRSVLLAATVLLAVRSWRSKPLIALGISWWLLGLLGMHALTTHGGPMGHPGANHSMTSVAAADPHDANPAPPRDRQSRRPQPPARGIRRGAGGKPSGR